MSFAFEPDTATFIAAQAGRTPPADLPLDTLRAGYREGFLATSVAPDQTVTSADTVFSEGGREVAGRIYTPSGLAERAAALVYVHGGGFAVGDLESHDSLCRLIARHLNGIVVAVDYRRAPENPWPAAMLDVALVFRQVIAEAARIGIDPERVALGGESAGATHAAAAALALRDDRAAQPRALWLMVPALDASAEGASYIAYAEGCGRNAAEFRYLWSLYAPDRHIHRNPYVSPSRAGLAGLPRVFAYPAEFDPVRDDATAFVVRAQAAGVTASLRVMEGLIHQYPEITGASAASRVAVEQAVTELKAFLSV